MAGKELTAEKFLDMIWDYGLAAWHQQTERPNSNGGLGPLLPHLDNKSMHMVLSKELEV